MQKEPMRRKKLSGHRKDKEKKFRDGLFVYSTDL